jgi:hypothetical protein
LVRLPYEYVSTPLFSVIPRTTHECASVTLPALPTGAVRDADARQGRRDRKPYCPSSYAGVARGWHDSPPPVHASENLPPVARRDGAARIGPACRPGKPVDNTFIEAFNGRMRDECLNQSWLVAVSKTTDDPSKAEANGARAQWRPFSRVKSAPT